MLVLDHDAPVPLHQQLALRDEGLIISVRGKGYYVTSGRSHDQ